MQRMGLQDDEALARKLKVVKPIVTMIRKRRLSITAPVLMWMHEASGLSIAELRALIDDHRTDVEV